MQTYDRIQAAFPNESIPAEVVVRADDVTAGKVNDAIEKLPGGVGGADGGLIAALALYGAPLAPAVAAVLAYRAFQLGLPALLGALAVIRLPGVLQSAPNVCEPAGEPTVRDARPSTRSIRPVGVATS